MCAAIQLSPAFRRVLGSAIRWIFENTINNGGASLIFSGYLLLGPAPLVQNLNLPYSHIGQARTTAHHDRITLKEQ
ncbi:hypothetical protein L596_013309 [Steinernema carpocapsae]|uniref:Uncharacterized protein n=1 Tax=Steinernema carpocapsae TaxID=34508 RepID=A0A4U5NZR5_STECR|nr:hypothetical protein L596_013309 [Steinernema carpocapsae]